MRITSVVFLLALAGLVGLHLAPARAAEGTVTATPLYRLHRLESGLQSFYTTRSAEVQDYVEKGWKNDGVECYVSAFPLPGGVFFWRLYHPMTGDYYYTADPKSRDDYQDHRGYLPQKAAGYVLPPGSNRPGTVPLYMFYEGYNKRHHYFCDKDSVNPSLQFVMEVCRVWPDAAVLSEIAVSSPKPGDVLTVGASHTITWTSTSNEGGVSLHLSTDGGASWKPLTAKPVANTGSLAWTVSAPITAHAQIKASWVDKVIDTGVTWASGVTQGEFSIVGVVSLPPLHPSSPGPVPPTPDPGNPPPNLPTLTATASPGPKVDLSWTPGGPAGVTGYTVERKHVPGLYGVIRVVPKNVTKIQDAGVAHGATYRYRVRAWIGIKPSVLSNEVVVTTP